MTDVPSWGNEAWDSAPDAWSTEAPTSGWENSLLDLKIFYYIYYHYYITVFNLMQLLKNVELYTNLWRVMRMNYHFNLVTSSL